MAASARSRSSRAACNFIASKYSGEGTCTNRDSDSNTVRGCSSVPGMNPFAASLIQSGSNPCSSPSCSVSSRTIGAGTKIASTSRVIRPPSYASAIAAPPTTNSCA